MIILSNHKNNVQLETILKFLTLSTGSHEENPEEASIQFTGFDSHFVTTVPDKVPDK